MAADVQLILLAAPRYLPLQVKVFTYDLACRSLHLHARRCAAQRGLLAKIRAPDKASSSSMSSSSQSPFFRHFTATLST
jgi:hypothetical protein